MDINNIQKEEKENRRPKLRTVDRRQGLLRPMQVDDLIGEDHPARGIWEFVKELDLSRFYESIESMEGEAGRSAFDPLMLVSLWVYAYSRGIGSAREVSRLCETDPAFQWLTGYQSVNAHTLSDFRVKHKKGLDDLFAQVLGVLSSVGLIRLERVTQDGTKVQANASSKTFRRRRKLRAHLKAARAQVAAMGDPEQPPRKNPPKSKSRKESAARERAKRIERALGEVEKLEEEKGLKSKKEEGQASTTDPDARMMKHGHGGILPSYNMQLSVDSEAKLIAGVHVTNAVNDSHQLLPAMERLEKAFGRKPGQVIADGDYTNYTSVAAMADLGIDYYGSWKQIKEETLFSWRGVSEGFYPSRFHYDAERDVYVCPAGQRLVYNTTVKHRNGTQSRVYHAEARDCTDCPHSQQCCPRSLAKGLGRTISRRIEPESTIRFKSKMDTEEAKEIYRQRSEIAEFPNLWIKTKNKLQQFYLRGLAKVGLEAQWVALAYNIHQWLRLRPSPAAELGVKPS